MNERAAVARFALLVGGLTLSLSAPSRDAFAQSPPAAPMTIALGDFQLAPTLEVRTRGEYRLDPVDVGGLDAFGNPTPRVRDAVVVTERARLGLGAERGALRAQITLQDARAWGASPSSGVLGGTSPFASLGAYEAFAEAHVLPPQGASTPSRQTFVRVGRQAIRWGDGMLLGIADWSPTGRSLDALRAQLVLSNWDFELLAAILDSPRPLGAATSDTAGPFRSGTELFGARAALALDPLAKLEVAALARVARGSAGVSGSMFANAQAAGETYTASLRAAGERNAFGYAVEGAGQLGSSPSLAGRDRVAFAATAHASYRIDALALAPTVRLGGAYASGDGSGKSYGQFDPILPDVHVAMGAMDVFALSNVIEGNARVTISPVDELRAHVEYRYARLARSEGEWLNGYLASIGKPLAGAELGHELDAVIAWVPWDSFSVTAGYSVMFLGDGARSVLAARARGSLGADGSFTSAATSHLAYLQATLRVP